MSAHEYTAAEAMSAAVHAIRARQGLVTIDQDGYVEMQTEAGCEPYGFEVTGVGDALRWIEHIAQKTWCTPTHLQMFAALAAEHFGVRYR